MNETTRRQMLTLLPRLRRFGYALSGKWDQADDLVQSTYLRAIESLGSLRQGSRLDAWMFQIMRNQFLNERRGESLRESRKPEISRLVPTVMDGPHAVESKITFEIVQKAVGDLPEEQRTALVLVAVEGLSYKETADLMAESVGTVASRVARARQTLKSLVERGPEFEVAKKPNDSVGEV